MALKRFLQAAILHNFILSVKFKAAFLLDICIAVFKQGLFLASWYFFFAHYQSINGWEFNDLLFVYGLISIGIGVVEILFFGLKDLAHMVQDKTLDRSLLQPQNLILNIAISKGQISSVADIATGVVAIAYAGFFTSHFVPTLLFIPLAIIFIFALYLYIGSLSFYIQNSSDFIYDIYRNAIIIASQPNSAYTGILKLLTITILPVAYISFYPMEYIKQMNIIYLLVAYLGTFAFLTIACVIFYQGIKKYE